MVRARHIVADGFGGVAAEEDRAGIADFRRQRLGVVRFDFEMLGRDGVGQRHRIVERADQDDRAEIAP